MPTGRPPQRAAERLRKLLGMLPWLARERGCPISELARRFDMPEREVVSLLELAACCGLPPYTPDRLMELIVSEDWVSADLGPHFSRPRRLTAAEGFAVAASARAILAVPGADPDGALARALAKLEKVLGDRVAVDLDEPPCLQDLRRAAEEGRAVEIEYYSASRDALGLRVVEPAAVFSRDGHWYVDAWCHSAGGRRLFRADRVRAVAPAEAPGGTRAPLGPDRNGGQETGAGGVPETFVPGPEAFRVTLRLKPGGRWVEDSYPIVGVDELGDGCSLVEMDVGGDAWLERLLLRLGNDAELVEPAAMAGLGRDVAVRILHRYEAPAGAVSSPSDAADPPRRRPPHLRVET